MKIAVMIFTLRAEWVHSLKEKRMIVKSLIAKLQNKYNVSVAEVDEQDTHQIIVIGVAAQGTRAHRVSRAPRTRCTA